MIKIIAFIVACNEEDVIEKCIENAREQELDPIVIDNGCTDRTIEIVRRLDIPVFENRVETYDPYGSNEWAIPKVKEIGCDWYVQKDADEMFETYDGRKIVEVVNEADDLGYNCMRFDMYEFWPTVDDDLTIKDFTKRIQYYSYYSSNYRKMIKNSPEIRTNNPHRPKGKIKESPGRLLFRHYRFRGLEQGREKLKNKVSRFGITKTKTLPFFNSARRFKELNNESGFYILEKDIYSKLHRFDGTWIKERVFDGWRGH